MDKEIIKTNIVNLTAEQLFDEINHGNITIEELQATGDLDVIKRRKIIKLQTDINAKDDEAWEKAKYGNELNLSDYISQFPKGKFIEDAKEKIKFLEDSRKKANAARQGLLNSISNNPNAYDPYQIINFIQDGTLSKDDLINCDIPNEVIELINNINPPYFNLGETPDSIPDGYTEVYFWGIPGSGKTCALAAVFSTAQKLGYLNKAVGPGYDYMTRLTNVFAKEYSILPAPSPTEVTQYLPFTLKKPNEKNHRSISLIELSGEIFQCFFHKNANKQLPSIDHENTFNALNKFLMGKNPKIHFFFIDYNKQNDVDSDGYTQADYLEAASTYFNNHKVFGKSTDAIYVVLTKSDLMSCANQERVEKAKDHLNINFSSFINTLKDNCKKNSINAGKVFVEPFSLGNVYFKQVCNFNNDTAINIINILMERIKPQKKSILDILNK